MTAAQPGEPGFDRAVPRLSHGARLQYEPAQQGWVLLFPEGMVKLNPSAAAPLEGSSVVAGDPATISDPVSTGGS